MKKLFLTLFLLLLIFSCGGEDKECPASVCTDGEAECSKHKVMHCKENKECTSTVNYKWYVIEDCTKNDNGNT